MLILIVEDDELVRKLLREWLEIVLPQCRMLEAGSGEAAIDIVPSMLPNVVIMDIDLPQMNGIETTRRIKALAPATQVVMLTIYEGDIYVSSAIKAGASAYVPKHKMQTELLPTLMRLLPTGSRQEVRVWPK